MGKEKPLWREVGGAEGLLAAYRQGVRDFSRANLENAGLSQTNLSGINLSQSDLRGANLSGTNLSEADLTGADLRGANLTQTNLRDACLTGGDLRQAALEQADLYRANLSWVNLSGQDLRSANLRKADLQGADLSEANLAGANLEEAKLDAANLREAVLTGAALNYAYMVRAQLVQADLRQADLTWADLTGANLKQCALDRCNLLLSRLRKANLQQASLVGAYLRDCNLGGANLTGAVLQKAHIAGAKLDGANFAQCDLRGAEIAETQRANLEGAILGELERCVTHHLHLELQGLNGSFAFSPNGDTLAFSAGDETIVLTDPGTGAQIAKIDIASEPVVSVVFSADGRTLHRSFYINELKLWHPQTGELIRNLKNHSANITSLALDGNAKVVGVTGVGEPFELFDVGHETRTFKGYSTGIATRAHSPDGRFTARSGADLNCSIELLDRQSGQTVRVLTGHGAPVQSLAFSPDSKILASTSAEDMKLWQVETGKEIYSQKEPISYLRHYYSPTVAFTLAAPSAEPILMCSDFFGVFEHRRATQSQKNSSEWDWKGSGGSSSSAAQVALSADRKVLARCYEDQPVQLWDLKTGEELGALRLNSQDCYPLALSPTGNFLAVGSGRDFVLWDVAANTALRTFTGHSQRIQKIAFSPDGQLVASGSWDRTIKLWDVGTGCEIQTLPGYDCVTALAFHPLEPVLASGIRDGTVKLWDVNTMEQFYSFRGHKEDVIALTFSPDGKWLASGDGRTIRLWEFHRHS